MMKTIAAHYYRFFDEKLSSGTFVVLIIATLVSIVGFVFSPASHADVSYSKGDIDARFPNTVIIEGEKYELIFSKIED